MNAFEYKICEFGGRFPDARVASDVARLHSELLGHSPLVLMGPEFMRDFYYSLLPADGFISGAVAYLNGEAVGFVVGTGDANGFLAQATKRHWFRLCWIVAKSLIRKPSRLSAMKEAYGIQSNVQAQEYGPEVGELLSFGVLPEFRSRKFIKETDLQVSSDLFDKAIEQLRSAGKSTIRAIVDKDNLEAQFFYRSNGWQVGLKSVEGWSVPTMEFLKDLR